jgi:glutamate--cysteine ligase
LVQELLHKKILDNCDKVSDWFEKKSQGLKLPFYSSFDIRDSQFKIVPVDANIFPAGFNNICGTDKESDIEIVREYLDSHYGAETKRVLLLTEEHTQNPYYWDNVWTLKTLLEEAGREVRMAMPKELPAPLELTSASGHKVTVYSAERKGTGIELPGFAPQLIINNNDFSLEHLDWANGLETPMNPPRELGWYRRRKDRFFAEYNKLATEFCELIGLDPWHLQVETERFEEFEVDDEASREKLSAKVQDMYSRIEKSYADRKIEAKPFLFIKNNAGTYGLGVISVQSPEEVLNWTYKSRKKMKAAKGGRDISEVIIQEGVPTVVRGPEGQTAEPALYMLGCQLAGGFLRTHGEKSPTDSLNSPGAVFKRLCVSDLKIKQEGCPMENAYGWVAKLAFLSVALEAKSLGVEFKNYKL